MQINVIIRFISYSIQKENRITNDKKMNHFFEGARRMMDFILKSNKVCSTIGTFY